MKRHQTPPKQHVEDETYDEWFIRQVELGLRDIERGDVLEHEEVVKEWERRRARLYKP